MIWESVVLRPFLQRFLFFLNGYLSWSRCPRYLTPDSGPDLKNFKVGYPVTSWAEHSAVSMVQSTLPISTSGLAFLLYLMLKSCQVGANFLQWPHLMEFNFGIWRLLEHSLKGGFHLYLLEFPFIYQLYSRIEALVSSSFANDLFKRIPASFQHHFKICLLWLLHEKECTFFTYLFCCTEMTWLFIISTTVWVNSWVTSSVASRARSELTNS